MNTLEPEILKLKEASEISPYSADYLRLLARRDRIGAFKKGCKWMITKDALLKYVNEMKERKTK
ncbi:MAG: helix-turn-helix domain-containing protein [archaeon]